MVTAADVTSCALLHALSPQRLNRLLAKASVRTHRRGEAVFRQDAPADAAWLVLEGWVHLVRMPREEEHEARAVVLYTVTPNDVLCGISAIEQGTYTTSGIAGTSSRMLRIPAVGFREALAHEPRFACHVLRMCAGRIRRMAQQYGAMTEPVSHRLIRAILRLQQQFGDTIPVTHRELAQMSWTTTESAIRSVRALKRDGYLAGSRGRLTVRRTGELERLLSKGHQ
ncbi:MAG: Crp/Fnr family transcriptional regulator [Candidatus Omnitrophica bacterium]|nr:Crp/Fnr family transcriptional regulator [Candidatus Omnitrophota bacterium]